MEWIGEEQRREKFRSLLDQPKLTSPASVFDPVSARLAETAGYEFGLLGGSIASAVVLGAPDVAVLTLTELAEQARRIGRGAGLPLMVDADHGFGNALSVRRTVEELEAAGVAALTIEDTYLPQGYGRSQAELISKEEFQGKLAAAIDARDDPGLTIIGRTNVAPEPDETLSRVECCTKAGVDAVFLIGRPTRELLTAIQSRAPIPLLTGFPQIPPAELIDLGVRIQTAGHQAFFVMLKALSDYYEARIRGEPQESFRSAELPTELRRSVLAEETYESWMREYLGIDPTRLRRI